MIEKTHEKLHMLMLDCLEASGKCKNGCVIFDALTGEMLKTKPDIYNKGVAKSLCEAKKSFHKAQLHRNEYLEKLYREELKKDIKCRCYTSLNNFVRCFQQFIYTKEQLVDFLSRFEEVKNPSRKAYYLKTKYDIKCISQEDIDNFVESINKNFD